MATGSVSPKAGKIVDIPNTPTIGTATAGVQSASLTFTAPTVGGPIRTYTALSSPGSITGTGTTSPISITGLTGGTAYTFQIRAENATGNSPYSSASNSVTPTVATSFESIATVSVGSGGSANVEFTSIPNTYTHLQVRVLSRNDRASTNFNNIAFQVNSDTGANYNSHLLRGDGSSVIAAADTSATSIDFIIQAASGAGANTMGAFVLDILDYANTNKYKTFRGLLGVDNNGSGYSGLMSAAWRSTSAITSIKFFPSSSGNITQYSHFALYGIKGA